MGLDADAAVLGELQGIADQVHQNLADPRRIALHPECIHARRDRQLERQPTLLRAVLEGLGATVDQVGQVERNMFQLQRLAFDAREVEDIVDHLEQMLGGLGGQRRVFGLLLGHLGGFQQLQHAQYAVHRRAQFVAHHRQEVRLRIVGALGFFTGLDQLRHGLLLFTTGLVEAFGQVVDVPRKVAQLRIIDNRQRRLVVALLDRLDRMAHGTDRLRQAGGQAPGEQEGKQQGEQRQDARP